MVYVRNIFLFLFGPFCCFTINSLLILLLTSSDASWKKLLNHFFYFLLFYEIFDFQDYQILLAMLKVKYSPFFFIVIK